MGDFGKWDVFCFETVSLFGGNELWLPFRFNCCFSSEPVHRLGV